MDVRRASDAVDPAQLPAHTHTEGMPSSGTSGRDVPAVRLITQALEGPRFRQLIAGTPAHEFAEEIAGCLRGPELDFSGLDNKTSSLVARLPASCWAGLQRDAFAASGPGITCVAFSSKLATDLMNSADATLIEGLNEVGSLRRLILVDPPSGRIDLVQLPEGSGSLPSVQIRCNGLPAAWDIHVASGCEVDVKAPLSARAKSTVHYWSDGQPVSKRTLGGLIYDSTTRDDVTEPASAIRLNGKALLESGDPIECRLLALFWSIKRAEHRIPGGTRLRYTDLADEAAITANVLPRLEDEYVNMHEAGAQALCEQAELGALLADLCKEMAVGGCRQFILATDNHVMAIELHIKSPSNVEVEFVASFYDPNRTALHERLVVSDPAMLRGRALADWIALPDHLNIYFEDPQCAIFAIYERPSPAAQASPATFLAHVPEEYRTSPKTLYYALQEGSSCVRDILREIGARCESGALDSHGLFELLQSVQCGAVPGLHLALRLGRTTAVNDFVDWVLNGTRETLSPQQRFEVLHARYDSSSGLQGAIEENRRETAAAYASLIKVAADHVLTEEHRRALLEGLPTDQAGYLASHVGGGP